jgi:phosphatidylglycerophosphatase C
VTAVRPGVAAFDFDGTLTQRDTLVPFLRRTCGSRRVAVAASRAALRGRNRSRDQLKLALLASLFTGWPADRLDALGEAYAGELRAYLRPAMLDRLRWHQTQHHAVVVVSASLGAYVRPLAAALAVDAVLAVEMVADGDGVLTGEVVGGANTRGPGKVECLRAWLAERFSPGTAVELWAYGDSDGDRELLRVADHPTWVRDAADYRGVTDSSMGDSNGPDQRATP